MVPQKKINQSGEVPPISEAWWTAVLQEAEERFTSKQANNALEGESIQETQPKAKSDEESWEHARELYQQDQVISMVVTGFNRGGLLVEGDDLQGFVPTSHLTAKSKGRSESEQESMLEAYIGKTIRLKVIECDPERGRVVLSERAALADPGKRIELLDQLQEGDCTTGRVTTITDFGAFVDLGGVEGLIHISELSWGRVCHPKDVVSQGQELEVCILQIDRERSRVALSLKRLAENPWKTIQARYRPGDVVEAVITNMVSFGAFARIEDGLDGLIHVSELRDTDEDARPEDVLSEGQRVEVCILNIDAQNQRLGLSLHTHKVAG